MRYGMAFSMEMYDFDRGCELRLVTMPGDYIRMCKWAEQHLAGEPGGESVDSLRRNYAAAWFAFSRLKKLEELGLPGELTVDAIDAMADRFSIDVEDMREELLPLAGGRGK